jgi:hypothetical protein
VLSIAGLAVLTAYAAPAGDARNIASVGVYGTTLILLYVLPRQGAQPRHSGEGRNPVFLPSKSCVPAFAGTTDC